VPTETDLSIQFWLWSISTLSYNFNDSNWPFIASLHYYLKRFNRLVNYNQTTKQNPVHLDRFPSKKQHVHLSGHDHYNILCYTKVNVVGRSCSTGCQYSHNVIRSWVKTVLWKTLLCKLIIIVFITNSHIYYKIIIIMQLQNDVLLT